MTRSVHMGSAVLCRSIIMSGEIRSTWKAINRGFCIQWKTRFTVSTQLFKSTQAATALVEFLKWQMCPSVCFSDPAHLDLWGDFDEFTMKPVRLCLTIFCEHYICQLYNEKTRTLTLCTVNVCRCSFLVYLVDCLLHRHCRRTLHFSPCSRHTPEGLGK